MLVFIKFAARMKLILTYLLFLCLPLLTGHSYAHASAKGDYHSLSQPAAQNIQNNDSAEFIDLPFDDDLFDFSLFIDDNEDDEYVSTRRKANISLYSSISNNLFLLSVLSDQNSYPRSGKQTCHLSADKYIFQRVL